MNGDDSSLIKSGVETSPYQRAARTALATALGLLGLWTVQGFWPALVWAGILAIAIWPLYRACARTLAAWQA